MSGPIAAAVRELMALGIEGEALLAAIGRIEDSMAPVESATDRRRRLDRERKQRVRNEADKSGHSAENADTEMSAEKRTNADISAPLARVRDNPSRLDTRPNLTTLNLGAGAFDNPGRAELDALEARLTEAVGKALASKAIAPRLFDLSPIVALLKTGKGPPADLEADVVPALQAAAARSSPGSIKTWGYFTAAIREARDRRVAGAPELGEVIQLPRGQGPPNLTAQIGADNAEARRRAFERMDQQHG